MQNSENFMVEIISGSVNAFPKEISCPLCNSLNFKYLFPGHDRLHCISAEFNIYKCKSCGVLFTIPQLSGNALKKFYPEDYYAYKDNTCNHRSLKEKLMLIFTDPLLFIGLSNGKLLSLLLSPFKRKTVGYAGQKVLDVGCGAGDYLKSLRLKGCELFGIDIGKSDEEGLAQIGIKFINCELRDAPFPDSMFDVITINHVFEHLDDPIGHAKKLYRMLKPGGRLIVGIPNVASINRYIFGRFWLNFDVPRHLFHYTPEVILRIFNETGFVHEKIRFNSVPGNFLGSVYYLLNSIRKKEIPLMKSKFWTNGLLSLIIIPYIYFTNLCHIGDQMEIIFRRHGK
jgi:2-polyprenyl-3-methyl-5-hydroxy-6-metoxy-1,4-benzoquinol methylase